MRLPAAAKFNLSQDVRITLLGLAGGALVSSCAHTENNPRTVPTVADTPSAARAADGQFISWVEHRIDDEQINGGIPIRGGDGLAVFDLDQDGFADIVSVHEDSNHLRVAFSGGPSKTWELKTLAQGTDVGAIEDVAIGDINGDGWPDIVAACEEAHLIYLQNPGAASRTAEWERLIPLITQGRGSWLRVFIADLNGDGQNDIMAANKGSSDIIDPSLPTSARPSSLFRIVGNPLNNSAWQEQEISREIVPNTAMPVDIDRDGDLDVLTAGRLTQTLFIQENLGTDHSGQISVQTRPIKIDAGLPVPPDWSARSSAFQNAFADLDADGRDDLILAVYETPADIPGTPLMAGLAWLKQPASLDQPWTYYPIGQMHPDVVIGIGMADIDEDGDLDAIVGGYSGLNIVKGGYSGASRDYDDVGVTASSTTGRIAWFENPGDARQSWTRHDISRRVRGMYDDFIPRDMDGDGDVDFISTRGNSGEFDGVFWLEQVRHAEPEKAFTPAHDLDSKALPLPPQTWYENYDAAMTYTAPNKAKP